MKKIFLTLITFILSLTAVSAETRKVVIISDIHMGDHRSVDPDNAWGWFNENRPKLIEFLEYIAAHPEEYGTLVVNGDMFDEWVAPMDVTPFINLDGEESRDEADFFQVLVHDNASVIDAFRKVKNAGIELVYTPGNHDMTCSKNDFDTYLPGLFTQARDAEGLGAYTPKDMDEVVIEHGHRYDFNDMPNPISQPGSILPIGYTISKYASTLKYNARQREKEDLGTAGSDEFDWNDLNDILNAPETETTFNGVMQRLGLSGEVSYEEFANMLRKVKSDGDYHESLNAQNPNDMSFDDQLNKFVYNAAWAAVMIAKRPASISELIEVMFTDVIFPNPYEYSYMYWNILPWFKEKPVIYDGLWPQATWEHHQDINNVPVKMPYIAAVLSGGVDPVLDSFAPYQYFDNPKSNKRIVVFGHTHKGLMNVFDDVEDKGKCVYVNTGCWIDEKWCDGEGVTMLTYVELEKKDKRYNIELKKWGQSESLASESIDIHSGATSMEYTHADDKVLRNGKYMDNGNVIILHDDKKYTISGMEIVNP